MLREVGREVLGHEIGVRIVVKDKTDPNEPLTREEEERLEKRRLREMAEQHPLVQKVARTFRAEIVDVWKEESRQ